MSRQKQDNKRLAKQRANRKNESLETKETKEKRLAKQRSESERKNESLEEREKRLAKQRPHRQSAKEIKGLSKTMTQLIRNFHKSVSTGPLYVCTCCEQLWYKHSVCSADRIRLVNPDIASKYLQNFKSVNNIEWLCNTCSNHLKKGKVPPCAIVNGMKFPFSETKFL